MTTLKQKSVFLMLLLLAAFTTVNAQLEANETVLQSFAPSELAEMDSNEIAWLNFLATESYVVSYNPEKSGDLPDLTERDPLLLQSGVNPFRAGITPQNENQYFRIGNTGKVVVFYAESRVQTLWERKQINPK